MNHLKTQSKKDIILTELMLKLSQLHEFYFDPELRVKLSGNANDEKMKEAEIERYFDEVNKEIKFLQLYNTTDKNYKYLVPQNKHSWKTNQYFKLYAFLQNENGLFGKFQQEDAEILWCLFAYVDATSHTEPVKYLFGPTSNKEYQDLNPHFLFRAYHIDSNTNKFIAVKYDILNNIAKAAYYARKKATNYSDVDFVYVLESYRKRTDFEFNNNIMYIPSGELDGCILQWLILILNSTDKYFNINEKIFFDLEIVKSKIIESPDEILLPFNDGIPRYILEWLHLWGLIKLVKCDQDIINSDFELLPRAQSMLYWFSVYLKSLQSQTDIDQAPTVFCKEKEIHYWRILALKDKFIYDDQLGYCYLANVDMTLQTKIVDNDKNASNDKERFLDMLKLMYRWRETINLDKDEGWQTFQKRCRFSTFIHYLVRFGEKGGDNINLSREPTGLLAFPVLWDTIKEERQPVGIFMSIIKENDDNENSCFKDFSKLEVRSNFQSKIRRIISVISLLAKVENIEVYQKGIRAHQEKEKYKESNIRAIAGSIHFLKSWINIRLRSKIPDSYSEDVDEILNIPEILNIISKISREENALMRDKILNASKFIRTIKKYCINDIIDEFKNITIENRSIKFILLDGYRLVQNPELEYVFSKLFYRIIFSIIAENAIANMPNGLTELEIAILPIKNNDNLVSGIQFKSQTKNNSDFIDSKLNQWGGLSYFNFFLELTNKGYLEISHTIADPQNFYTNLYIHNELILQTNDVKN